MINKSVLLILLSVCYLFAFETKVKFESNWFTASEGLMGTGMGVSGGIIVKNRHCIELIGIFDPFAILPVTDVETDTELSFYSFNIGYSYRFKFFKDLITLSPGLLFGLSDRPIVYSTLVFTQADESRTFVGKRATRRMSVTTGIQTDVELGRNETKFVLSGRGHYEKPSGYIINVSLGIVFQR